MNTKQFRHPANRHSRTAIVNGRVGGYGFQLISKVGQSAIGLNLLGQLLAQAKQKGWLLGVRCARNDRCIRGELKSREMMKLEWRTYSYGLAFLLNPHYS